MSDSALPTALNTFQGKQNVPMAKSPAPVLDPNVAAQLAAMQAKLDAVAQAQRSPLNPDDDDSVYFVSSLTDFSRVPQ